MLIGVWTMFCAYSISKHRDPNKIPKLLLGSTDIKRIKDTTGFLNCLIKASYLVGFSTALNGVVFLIEKYLIEISFLPFMAGCVMLTSFSIYGYWFAVKIPKFYL